MITPSQTVGPYFAIGLRDENELVADGVRISGRVLDGNEEPVSDAVVEIWQADEDGRYRPDFGWGRSSSDEGGRYTFVTCKPGPVDGQAPHVTMLVFARGLLKPVLTRMYFPDEEEANSRDPVLAAVDDPTTLVARPAEGGLEFDVRLQGDRGTIFFAV